MGLVDETAAAAALLDDDDDEGGAIVRAEVATRSGFAPLIRLVVHRPAAVCRWWAVVPDEDDAAPG